MINLPGQNANFHKRHGTKVIYYNFRDYSARIYKKCEIMRNFPKLYGVFRKIVLTVKKFLGIFRRREGLSAKTIIGPAHACLAHSASYA